MQIHPRYFKVAAAEAQIGLALSKMAVEHELTCAEMVQILAGQLQSFNKYVIRYERHGNMEDKADEA